MTMLDSCAIPQRTSDTEVGLTGGHQGVPLAWAAEGPLADGGRRRLEASASELPSSCKIGVNRLHFT